MNDPVEDLRCRVTEESWDPDGHTIEYFFEWSENDGGSVEGWPLDGLTQDFFQEDMTDGETWTCTVTALDELNAESEPISATP